MFLYKFLHLSCISTSSYFSLVSQYLTQTEPCCYPSSHTVWLWLDLQSKINKQSVTQIIESTKNTAYCMLLKDSIAFYWDLCFPSLYFNFQRVFDLNFHFFMLALIDIYIIYSLLHIVISHPIQYQPSNNFAILSLWTMAVSAYKDNI